MHTLMRPNKERDFLPRQTLSIWTMVYVERRGWETFDLGRWTNSRPGQFDMLSEIHKEQMPGCLIKVSFIYHSMNTFSEFIDLHPGHM